MAHYFKTDENLKSEIKKITYNYKLYDFCFYTDNGVFSKDKIDYGSKLLLETYLDSSKQEGSVLDLGCGYGFLGIVIAKVNNSKLTMVDVNKRSLHLTKMNLKENNVTAEVIESNIYENITDKYDVIIVNPPIRAGNEVIDLMLLEAKNYLNKDGSLWFVMRKDHGAKSYEKKLEKEYILEKVNKSKGFYIFKVKNR